MGLIWPHGRLTNRIRRDLLNQADKGQSITLGTGGPTMKLESLGTFSRHATHGVTIGAHIGPLA